MHSFSHEKQSFMDSHVTFIRSSKLASDAEQEEDTTLSKGKVEGMAFKQPLESQLLRVHSSLIFLHVNCTRPT